LLEEQEVRAAARHRELMESRDNSVASLERASAVLEQTNKTFVTALETMSQAFLLMAQKQCNP
jgi:hypothetical protein